MLSERRLTHEQIVRLSNHLIFPGCRRGTGLEGSQRAFVCYLETTAMPEASGIGATRPGVDTRDSRMPVNFTHQHVVLTVPEVPDGRF